MKRETRNFLLVGTIFMFVVFAANYLTFGMIKLADYALAPEIPKRFISVEFCNKIHEIMPHESCAWPE